MAHDIFGWKVRERGDGNLAFDPVGNEFGLDEEPRR